MSLLTSGATAISPIGLLIAGPFSDWLGIRVWFWAGGSICVMIALTGFFIPAVTGIENHRETQRDIAADPMELPATQ
jgi:MFS family permease